MEAERYWFTSNLFEIEAGNGEDLSGHTGSQLARWLRESFMELGYEVEDEVPEDRGWRLVVQCDPYPLSIVCGHDAGTKEPLPSEEDIRWFCFATAELPFLKRVFKRSDSPPDLALLDAQLRDFLEEEPMIQLVE